MISNATLAELEAQRNWALTRCTIIAEQCQELMNKNIELEKELKALKKPLKAMPETSITGINNIITGCIDASAPTVDGTFNTPQER